MDEASIQAVLGDTVLFSKILAWIVSEMKAISKLDEGITEIKNVKEDLVSFQMDLSSLLKGMLNSCVPGLKLLLILFCTHFRIGLHVRETKYWQFR